MVIYAGLRSAMGKIPSLKLNVIAQKEIGDTKLDYSEEGSIKELPYENFWKYCLYSIKDTLLQLGIHRKTDDISSVYSRMLEDGLLANEVFTSTIQLTNSLSTFLLEHDYIPGNNFNKFNDEQKLKQQAYFYGSGNDIASDENDAMMNAMVDPDDLVDTSDDEEEEDDSSSKKKKKFSGAMVQDPNRMLPTGFKINGRLNSRIHNNVGDMDITSEYPTAIILSNMSSETLIARVEFVDDLYDWIYVNKGPKWIEEHRIVNNAIRFTAEDMMDYRFNRLPMYNYDFIDEDAAKYKLNMSDTITMLMAFDDVVHIGTQFCNLPDYDELVRNNMVITRKKTA